MTSAHPYRQGYAAAASGTNMSQLSASTSNSQRSSLHYQQQGAQQQTHTHHPLRPADRPYVRMHPYSSSSSSVNSTHTKSSDALKSPPLAPFRASHHGNNSVSSSTDSVTRAPDTPKGLTPTKTDLDSVSVTSSPVLAPARGASPSPYGSSVSIPRHSIHSSSHSRSISSASVVTNSFDQLSHQMISQQLGSNSNSLLPKLKTIELYRINAKKSHDPEVLFQYARYMLNTAIFIDVDLDQNEVSNGSSLSLGSHKKSKSTTSLVADPIDLNEDPSVEEKRKLKKQFLKEALHYLKKLSDKGYTEAQYLLADAYSSGALGKADDREAFLLFQSAAKHGHVESAYRTSFCYEVGVGTSRDSRKALEFLKYAATKNHPSAMYKMGLYSFYGRMGFSNNINTKKDGIKWLKRASENANELIAAAPYELGKIHYEGFLDIIIQDKVYALDLYRLAASLGHIQSAAILAKHYELGDVIPQDADLSIHYYTMAAMGGDAESMLGLCGWFMVGAPNLEPNQNEAFEWALKAANAGFPKAQFATGHFLEKGIGCEKNQSQAMVWFQKAAENGEERAIKKLKGSNIEKKDEKKGWVKKLFN